MEARPWVIWFWWNGVLKREEIARQLRELSAAGFGGAEIRCVTFHGWGGEPLKQMDATSLARIGHKRVEYLSNEFVELLEHTCETAKSLGLRLSINMGQGWPPGGPWITDEHRTKLLSWHSHEVEGPSEFVVTDLPAGSFALAWKITDVGERKVDETSFRNLAGEVETAGGESALRWKAPDGKWLVGIFRVTPGGIADKGDGPEVDPASRAAVLYHLNYFFGRIDPKLRRFYGETLVEIASDSWEYSHNDKRYWSPAIVESFPKLAGYDLRRKLYALLEFGPEQVRVLRDLESVEQSLVHESFFSTVRQFLHERGLRRRPQVYGRGLSRDYLKAYALADIPEVEAGIILPEAPWAAHAVGNPLVTAEAFTFLSTKHEPVRNFNGPDETTPALLRWHANHYYAEGINRLNMHSYSYSPQELPLPGWRMYAEIHLNRTVPWWPAMPSVTTWMARNQWCLQAGSPVAEVLVYPVVSNPAEPPYNAHGDQQPISAANGVVGLNAATLPLFADTAAKGEEQAVAEICVLSDVNSASEAEALLALSGSSSRLTYCGAAPEEWTALRHDSTTGLRQQLNKLRDEGRLIDGRTQGWQAVVDKARRVRWPSEAKLAYQHRRVGDAELYFLVNCGDSFFGEVSFPHSGRRVEVWDADMGEIRLAAEVAERKGSTHVKCSLGHFESTLISFGTDGTEVDPVRVVQAQGGAFTIDDGQLVGRFDRSGEYRIRLSDGREVTETIGLPPPQPVTGPWQLRVPAEFAVSQPISKTLELKQLSTWRVIPELEFFAGTVAYSTDFPLSSDQLQPGLEWQLDLGQVFEVARVWVNETDAGVAWSPPFRLPITQFVRPGRNTLRIEVSNLLKNHLDRSARYTRPSGLLGPVTLAPVSRRIIWPSRDAP